MKKIFITAWASLLGSSFAFVQTSDPTSLVTPVIPSVTQAEEISVTATRVPTRSNALVSDVQVFEREQIARAVGKSLPDFLQQAANIQISNSGGPGQPSSVFTRGTDSNHTLVLIDGVRYGAISNGAPGWVSLPLASIERIEVLKGPGSTLYGSDAVGGVVQIFTKRGEDGFHPSIRVSAGSRKMTEAIASVSGGGDGVRYSLGASDLYDRSFSASNLRVGSAFQPDRDSFSQSAYNASLDWDMTENWKGGASVFQSNGDNRFDDGATLGVFPDSVNEVSAALRKVFVRGQILPRWSTGLSYGQTKDDIETSVSNSGSRFFNTTQNQLSWQNDVALPYLGTLLAGAEHLQQKLDSSTQFDINKRTIQSIFTGVNGSHSIHSWQLNWRLDHNSQFGSENTGFAGYGIQVLPSLRLRASYGTSFSAPTFNDLFFPGFSNPNLRPEKGRSTEIGAEWDRGLHSFTLTGFENRIRDLIIFDGIPRNVSKTRIRGWNLGYSTQIGPVALNANYEHLDPKNEATGQALIRRAKEQFTLKVEYLTNAWRFDASVLHEASRPDSFFDTSFNRVPVTLDAYTVLGLGASYAISKKWNMRVQVDNVTNQRYETALGYNQPRRSFYVTAQYQF